MLRVHGPTYRYQGESLADDIIYIDDHHWNQDLAQFPVQELLQASERQHLLVFDHLAHDDALASYDHVCLPVYLAAEVETFRDQKILPDWSAKTVTFNFMINKPRPNRQALLDMIEKHHLRDFRHTLCWRTSAWPAIPVTDYRFGPETQLDQGIKNGSFSNALTYQKLLQARVIEPTCISLITEPCFYEREAMITEKTLMAIYGGTIPIWIGGWRLPDVMRDLGFDVFDDIVDHSYSQLADPWARLKAALDLNLSLLRDRNRVLDIIACSHDRLCHNLQLIENNVFLDLVRDRVAADTRLREIAHLWSLPV